MVFGATWFIPFYLNYIRGLCFSLSIWSLTCTSAMHLVLLDICFTWNIGMFHVKHSSSCLFCSSLQLVFYLLNKELREIVIFVFGVTWFIPFYLNYILELFFSLSILSLTCTLVISSYKSKSEWDS